MFFLKILLIINLFFIPLFAKVQLQIKDTKVKNAQTLLLEIYSDTKISDVKLSLENRHFSFSKNRFKENSFYALIPISYYEKIGKKRVIISYLKDDKRYFKGKDIQVIDALYKSEKIKVSNSKVQLSNKNKKRTNKEYKEAMKIYKTISKDIYWKEDFIMPLNSKITSDFGTKRVYNQKLKSYHSGIDFKAKVGTAIIASNDGIVKLSSNRFYAGNSIVIDHGKGVFTCYFHLNKMLVKKNQYVKKGEIIGFSGNTGRVTGPHLHFATRVNGVLVEPKNLFSLLNSLN